MRFDKINNITGWIVFAIATITYLLTVERTASYWDCGEFIAVSYKLMVPHPPGAPFYLLLGRMFSFLAFGDVTQVAYWINILSVLSSGFTILFLFWSISLLGRKLLNTTAETATQTQTWLIMSAGVVGGLAYTFSDSFWFSAVEAEVYAMSSFFTAFVVWAILKWEIMEDESRANRWLILIAYMMGLSIGVHLLNLVTIPALALIFYFKKSENIKLWGIVKALVLSLLIVLFIMEGVITGLPGLMGTLEIEFVNSYGMPFGTGVAFFMIALVFTLFIGIRFTGSPKEQPNPPIATLLIGLLFFFIMVAVFRSALAGIIVLVLTGIMYAHVKSGFLKGLSEMGVDFKDLSRRAGKALQSGSANTFFLCVTFLLIGYSSYNVILIRSNFDPPIDENDPENIISFVSYLKREQYGNRPLFQGQYYDAQVVDQVEGEPVYDIGKDSYVIVDRKVKQVYDPNRTTILPRIYSADPNHVREYQRVLDLGPNELPNFSDNIKFMLKHQMGHMYWRYFMWNFSGRQSDIQNAGYLFLLTNAMEEVPPSIARNKARNNYYSLPLILGLIGMFFNFKRNPRNFAVMALLFFLTGLGLIIYLNSPPIEPRERDYIYAGSFYVFAFWIGFAVFSIYNLVIKAISKANVAIIVTSLLCLTVPVIMASENWDDHNRDNRYFSVDSARNFLNSCSKDAILFTGGDNDTFPLWYAQDVEEFRTDMRVVVLSYFNTDWYIEQMTRPAYESAPFPFSLTENHYRQGGPNDYLPYYERPNISGAIDLKQYMQLIKQDHPGLRLETVGSGFYNSVPTRSFYLDINKEEVIAKGIIPKGMEDLVVDRMYINLRGRGLEKKDLMILDLIVNSNWDRPLYFNNTSRAGINMDLDKYLIQEGNAYRLLPIENPNTGADLVNTTVMYENLMNRFYFREMDDPNVYFSEDYRNFVVNHRMSFNTLAGALLDEGQTEKAREVIIKSLEIMPDKAVPYDHTTATMVDLLFTVGEKDKAVEIAEIMSDRANRELEYYLETNINLGFEIQKNMVILSSLTRTLSRYGEDALAKNLNDMYNVHRTRLQVFSGPR